MMCGEVSLLLSYTGTMNIVRHKRRQNLKASEQVNGATAERTAKRRKRSTEQNGVTVIVTTSRSAPATFLRRLS